MRQTLLVAEHARERATCITSTSVVVAALPLVDA
jgi:hypothetical protein